MAMKVGITGGSGNLGSSLIPCLLEHGHQVVVMDRALPASPIREAKYLRVDTRDYANLAEGLRGCDALVHLAAHRSPLQQPDTVVYNDNTTGSYNVLSAAAALGISRVCLASSANALGGTFSRRARYDYFPLDEDHPTYADDPYSLSKWVLECQADAFARRYLTMQVASLRFHWLMESRERAVSSTAQDGQAAVKHLWSYTLLHEASRACLLALTADFAGHEVFFITAPRTAATKLSLDLARDHYPMTKILGDLGGHAAFHSSVKAERLLGWKHEP
jgi:nucleoside-diphosphate-sugar epimerase